MAVSNILVTGAGGYIGGSIVSSLVRAESGPLVDITIHAAVRSDDQVQSLADLPVKVFQADLYDESAMANYIVQHEINIVVNTASCIDEAIIMNQVKALGARRKVSGKPVYFVHTSGASAADTLTGWTFGRVKDTDPIFDLESKTADSYILRKMDVSTIVQAEANNVIPLTIWPVNIYGKGSGTWNKMSLHVPGYIKSSIKYRKVYKFGEERFAPLVHIDDLTRFYIRLLETILEKPESLPTGKTGYYFVQSHQTSWWAILEALSKVLFARGLVYKPGTEVWPSEDVIKGALGVPAAFAYSIWNSGSDLTVENAHLVGWKPEWDADRLIGSLNDEIDAALDEEANKSSLVRSIQHM